MSDLIKAEVASAEAVQLRQTDTLIIADALRHLAKDTERHELDRTRAEELREQILQYGASMCSSAEAVQGWIPCSERLPNVGEDVLFCDSKWTEEGCLRADGDWWQFRWSTIIPKVEVIAWMPLPKPYREDGEA